MKSLIKTDFDTTIELLEGLFEDTQADETEDNKKAKEQAAWLKTRILDSITDKGVPYDTIRLLARVYKKAAKEELKNNSELLESFWSKCKEIAGSINIAESKYNKLSSLEKVQYFYNAYIIESYLQNTLGLHYSTSSDDHNILHTSKVKSASKADFDNLNILGANKFSVEIKCYGNTQDAKEYLDGEDRSYFYDADFILVYIMSGGFW